MLRAFSFLLIELHMKQDFVFLLAGACFCAVAAEDAAMQRCRDMRDAAARFRGHSARDQGDGLAEGRHIHIVEQ